jgi:hypothetical protein
MERNRNKQVKRKPRKQRLAQPRLLNRAIPQIQTNFVKSHRFRFLASSAVTAFGITNTDIGGASGVVGSAALTVSMVNQSFRLKRIDIWAPTSASATGAITSVEWLGTANSPNKEVSDISVNVSQPAFLSTKPPPLSLASFWQLVSSSNVLFVLTCPGGSVIDVTLDLIENDSGTAINDITVVTESSGVLYYLALDGVTNHKLVPVSLNTTF